MIWFTAAAGDAPGSTGGVRVHRTWMPNAYPSSYAIGFASGLNFCFDPIRANVIYAWQGDYVDLSATVNGKIPRDAAIRGTIFYESLTAAGFRSEGSADPSIRFRAFRIRSDVPEFEYDVDGTSVRESVFPTPDGKGLIRQFRITTGERALSYHAPEPAEVLVDSGPAKRNGPAVVLPPRSTVVFHLTLPRR